ncbi:hypothetical protein JTE90_026160 [Oedothorax gibbosus]|uniref:Uncharacterized protein n=1 Tax=Oedothorax gibbosus TaxID=931172 RepID=A0AAV6UF53_9ARAC|nr:hypothetical protein JTE90_026160 [Oedothorax gibbosus]
MNEFPVCPLNVLGVAQAHNDTQRDLEIGTLMRLSTCIHEKPEIGIGKLNIVEDNSKNVSVTKCSESVDVIHYDCNKSKLECERTN